jgi:hypothetical protein
MMFWAVGAASMSGIAITALFAIVEIGQFAKRAAQRNALKRYASGLISLGFLCLLIARACYLARVLAGAETPPNPSVQCRSTKPSATLLPGMAVSCSSAESGNASTFGLLRL